MEQPNKKNTKVEIDVKRVTIFTFLMAIVLGALISLYCISRPYLEQTEYLDLVFILGLIAIIVGYLYAVVGGVPLPRPKTGFKTDI